MIIRALQCSCSHFVPRHSVVGMARSATNKSNSWCSSKGYIFEFYRCHSITSQERIRGNTFITAQLPIRDSGLWPLPNVAAEPQQRPQNKDTYPQMSWYDVCIWYIITSHLYSCCLRLSPYILSWLYVSYLQWKAPITYISYWSSLSSNHLFNLMSGLSLSFFLENWWKFQITYG